MATICEYVRRSKRRSQMNCFVCSFIQLRCCCFNIPALVGVFESVFAITRLYYTIYTCTYKREWWSRSRNPAFTLSSVFVICKLFLSFFASRHLYRCQCRIVRHCPMRNIDRIAHNNIAKRFVVLVHNTRHDFINDKWECCWQILCMGTHLPEARNTYLRQIETSSREHTMAILCMVKVLWWRQPNVLLYGRLKILAICHNGYVERILFL